MLAHRQLMAMIGAVSCLGHAGGIRPYPFDAAGTRQIWLPLALVLGPSAAAPPADPPGLVRLKLTGSWWRIPETVRLRRAMATGDACGMCVWRRRDRYSSVRSRDTVRFCGGG